MGHRFSRRMRVESRRLGLGFDHEHEGQGPIVKWPEGGFVLLVSALFFCPVLSEAVCVLDAVLFLAALGAVGALIE